MSKAATAPVIDTAPAPVWTIDPAHSSVTFSVRHLMISKVRGEFGKVEGEVTYDPTQPEQSRVSAVIDVASINTREPNRDAHLRSPDFFHVAEWPTMRFESRRVHVTDDGLAVEGELTIRDATRPVTLHVDGPTDPHKDLQGQLRIGASATAKIKRSTFGMTWNMLLEAGGVAVGDEITIQLDVSLVRA